MAAILYQDLISKLQELNPDIGVDNTGSTTYGTESDVMRTGIHYQKLFICNVDKGFIPEFDLRSNPKMEYKTVSPTYALANKDICKTQPIIIEPANIVMYAEVHRKLGNKMQDEIMFGTYPMMATRERLRLPDGSTAVGFLLRRYVKEVPAKSHVEKIGWRRIFEGIIKVDIPNVTRKAINKKFDVVTKKGFMEIESFADYKLT